MNFWNIVSHLTKEKDIYYYLKGLNNLELFLKDYRKVYSTLWSTLDKFERDNSKPFRISPDQFGNFVSDIILLGEHKYNEILGSPKLAYDIKLTDRKLNDIVMELRK